MAVHPDSEAFLSALFARCMGGFLTLTALPPTEVAAPTPSRHIRLGDHAALHESLERLAATNELGWGACVSVATRRAALGRYRRGGRPDLLELPALFVDIDKVDSDSLKRLDSFPLPPSIQVASGFGRHCFWLIDQPICDFTWADRALKGLAQRLDGDSVMTSANAMRLPGTMNTKPGRDNALCHLLELHPDRYYPMAAFIPYLAHRSLANTSHPVQRLVNEPVRWTRDTYLETIKAIEVCLLRQFDGFWKRNGWLSALCPLGHERDRPGQHFGFHPSKGGYCFGRHGPVDLVTLCTVLRLC